MDASQYAERMAREVRTFAAQGVVHDLPPIHHYYSAKYIAPLLARHGYADNVDFFVRNIAAYATTKPLTTVVSYGAGNAEVELEIAKRLRAEGLTSVRFDCIDVNGDMLERARAAAEAAGLAGSFELVHGDVTSIATPREVYDVHIAHQSLHHVVDLEGLYSAIERRMNASSTFLTADMIGRNGHMLWPEALTVVEKLWGCLLPRHRYNQQLGQLDDELVNFDCSREGFEGIRAEDVLPLLVERFAFEELVAWGSLVDVFVGRAYGPNFDVGSLEDRRFIDYVCDLEVKLGASGVLKPTQMLAKLRRRGVLATPIDVTPFVRRGSPPELPDVADVAFQFARRDEILDHVMRGDDDVSVLADGFHPWESGGGIRWTSRVFTLRFDLPREPAPFRCAAVLDVLRPRTFPPAGAKLFANGVQIGSVEDVYENLDRDPRLLLEFDTFGGPTTITVALDRAQPSPAGDSRELGLVVTRLSVSATRE